MEERSTVKWKGKARANIQQQGQLSKEEQKQYFDAIYDPGTFKEIKFKPMEHCNTNRHFYLPTFFKAKNFKISKAEMAVYPVLCSRADFVKNEWFQISIENIAKLSGVSQPTVNKALQDLSEKTIDDLPFVERKLVQVPKSNVRCKLYRVNFIRRHWIKEGWKYYPFHHWIIESGLWAKLSSRSKSLYLAFRHHPAYFNEALYFEVEQLTEDEEMEFTFEKRKWEVVNESLKTICKTGRVQHTNLTGTIKELEDSGLVERIGKHWKVYLRPKNILKS